MNKEIISPGIIAIAHALPERIVRNDELEAFDENDEIFIRDKLGITERRLCNDDETVSDLCVSALGKLIEDGAVKPDDIDALCIVTQTPDYCLPHVSALVQDRLGLRNDIAAFDVGLGCSGYVYGLSLMSSFMAANSMKRGVLVTADAYSKIIDPADRNTALIFGDGASATLLGDKAVYGIGRTTFNTDGSRHQALIAPGTGTREGAEGCLSMDGRAIFNFMMKEVPDDVEKCLKLNGLDAGDIDLWVFHQASRYMLKTLGQRMGIAAEKLVIDIEKTGNTTSSSIPIALERSALGIDPMPRRIMLSGFGVGLSWASTVLTLEKEA